ncbi:MAG: D-amino-acid dehydrogenase [Verrucomicrobiales bacterium]|jgi:D-amino-acid dehydrogenase
MSQSGKGIVIVGGGVIGLSIAYQCLKRGHGVTLLERGSDTRDCCSLGNAGMVVPSHFIPLAAPGMMAKGLRWMLDPGSPFYVRPRINWDLLAWGWRFYRASTPERVRAAAPVLRDLSLRSRQLFVELDGQPEFDFELVKRGLLMLCKTPEMLEEEADVVAQANALGVEAKVLESRELAALDPGIEMKVEGAVHFPQDCHLSPNRFVANLQNAIEQMGGRIMWNSEVTAFDCDKQGHVSAVVTKEARYPVDECVIATGAWSAGVARLLPGLRLSVQAGKGYSVTLKQPAALPELCSILCEAKVAVTPMGDTLRFGGTMEIAGLDQSINRRRVAGILQAIPRFFPQFEGSDFSLEPVWSGLRPCSPDGLPYIGRSQAHGNVLVAAGHGMLGLSLAPVTGETIAALVSDEEPVCDLQLLSPDRY